MKAYRNNVTDAPFPYPKDTGRVKDIMSQGNAPLHKIALIGDSTLDNGFWVQ